MYNRSQIFQLLSRIKATPWSQTQFEEMIRHHRLKYSHSGFFIELLSIIAFTATISHPNSASCGEQQFITIVYPIVPTM
jgi:hypothetical protein